MYTSGRNTAGSHNSRNSRIATANWIECLMCLCFMDTAGWLLIKDSIAHAWLPGDGHVSSCKNLSGFQPSWFWSSHKRGYFTHSSLQGQSCLKLRQVPPSLLVWRSFWKSFKYYVIILRGFSQRDYGNILEFEGYQVVVGHLVMSSVVLSNGVKHGVFLTRVVIYLFQTLKFYCNCLNLGCFSELCCFLLKHWA